ncbi:MAG: hypothetical protein M3Q47_07225 [Actinomycetota bacterium]|nr:hypothetical protein [Actinomycetota bacterium]
MSTEPEPLVRILAAELGITEIEVRRHVAEAVRAGLVGVENHPTDEMAEHHERREAAGNGDAT